MTSNNRTVDKCIDLLVSRREKLRDKKQNLRNRIDERYPFEIYGCKGDQVFDDKKAEIDREINELSLYISGMYDLIEIIEARQNGKVLQR